MAWCQAARPACRARWSEVPGLALVLHQIADGHEPAGDGDYAATAAVVGLLDVADALVRDPVLLPQTADTAVRSLVPLLVALQGALPAMSGFRDQLLLAGGSAVVCVAECANASQSFSGLAAAADEVEVLAGLLAASSDSSLRHLSVRLRLAVIEAGSPNASDGAWDAIQQEATGWRLDDRDAALVLARYARARAVCGATAEANAAWQRAVEFGSRARLFADIGGWLSAQTRLRYRYGPVDFAETSELRQMINLLGEQPSQRMTPIGGLREQALQALRGEVGGLRMAALAAQHLRVLAAAAGLWDDELQAHDLLADVFARSGEPLLAEFHYIRSGNPSSAKKLASEAESGFLDVTPELERPAHAERSAAYAAIGAQAELIPDALACLIAEHAVADIEAVHAGTITETPFAGTSILVSAAEAAAAVAGRVSPETAQALMSTLDPRLDLARGRYAHTDESHLRMLTAIAAGDDDDSAAGAAERLTRLLGLESPVIRHSGLELGPVVTRRPETARAILTSLAEQGSAHAAELLTGWSLANPAGRGTAREAAEESAWQAALPFAEAAAQRLASPPAGQPGSASLIVGFGTDAALVTSLDSEDVNQA